MLPFQSNLTLLSAADRQTLQRLVDIFLSQGLTFLQTRQEEGHYDYVLEPYVSPWLALAPGPGVATDDLVSPPTIQAGWTHRLCGVVCECPHRRVDLVVRFAGLPGKPLLAFPYATRQLIASEVGGSRCGECIRHPKLTEAGLGFRPRGVGGWSGG